MQASARFLVSAVATLALAGLLTPAAVAGETTARGTVTYIGKPLDATALGGNGVVSRVHMKGVVIADDANSPLHLSSQDCYGSTVVDGTGEPKGGAGSCDGVDRDGDVWWIWWRNAPDSRTWGFIGGTGKWQGVTGGGTTGVLAAMPDGRTTISWLGKWTMK